MFSKLQKQLRFQYESAELDLRSTNPFQDPIRIAKAQAQLELLDTLLSEKHLANLEAELQAEVRRTSSDEEDEP